MRRLLAGLVLVAGAGAMPCPVLAACNPIPGTIRAYDGVLGTTNRPFAAPGERVEIGIRDCDTASPGISSTATDHLVTVVFTPPSGARHAVVLTAAPDCSAVVPKVAACGKAFPSMQLTAATGACWEAEYDAPFALQTAAQLKVKSN